MRFLSGVAVVASLGAAGAGGAVAVAQEPPPKVCTLVGCDSGVFLDGEAIKKAAPRARTVTLCMDDRCRKAAAGADGYFVDDATQAGPGPVRVRMVVRDRRGKVLLREERRVTLKRSQPNGPECAPTCWTARVAYDAARKRLVER